MALNNLLNLFQLTVVIVVLTYAHRLIVNLLPFFIAAFFHFFAEPNEAGKKHLLFTYWMSSLLASAFLILGLVATVRIIEIPYPIKLAELGLIANSKERDVIVSMSEENHPIKVVTTKNQMPN